MNIPLSPAGRSRHPARLRLMGRHLHRAGRAAGPHLARAFRAMRPYLLWILWTIRWGSVIAGSITCLAFAALPWAAWAARVQLLSPTEFKWWSARLIGLLLNGMAIGSVLGLTALAVDRRVRSLGMLGLLLSLVPILVMLPLLLRRLLGFMP